VTDSCNFCSQAKTVQHLFFLCPIAKVVWGCIAIQIGADCIPSSALQYYKWADKFLVLNTCKPCVFQQPVGPFGRCVIIRCVLRKNLLKNHMRYISCLFFSKILGRFSERNEKRRLAERCGEPTKHSDQVGRPSEGKTHYYKTLCSIGYKIIFRIGQPNRYYS
jgi:hypothetical protein